MESSFQSNIAETSMESHDCYVQIMSSPSFTISHIGKHESDPHWQCALFASE
jgi:hypothetical protein